MRLFSSIIPYLLLVSFSSGSFYNLTTDKINYINASPFYGVALPSVGIYEVIKPTEKDFATSVRLIQDHSKKQIWPWVFFNRFYGHKEGGEGVTHSPLANKEYFNTIKGMDLWNETGALDDFFNIWKMSLKMAKELGSPGIFVDAEAYNNYKLYDLSYLTSLIGKSELEVKQRLKEVGAILVDMVNTEYPQAILWFTFTGICSLQKAQEASGKKSGVETVGLIVQGMLQRAKETNSQLKIVGGGLYSSGYCYRSLDDLKNQVNKRHSECQAVISRYPHFALGGTIAPWKDSISKKDYFTRGKCAERHFS